MLQVSGVSLQFGSRKLFEDVNIKFTKGNCYGIIGANGAGKSTFLKILSGELDTQKGEVILDKNERMSVLKQDQNAYNDETVLRTVMLGHKRLVEVMDEKEVASGADLQKFVVVELRCAHKPFQLPQAFVFCKIPCTCRYPERGVWSKVEIAYYKVVGIHFQILKLTSKPSSNCRNRPPS